MAFVLVQHLAPDHESILGKLVEPWTRMPVLEIEDGVVVRPDCVYVIPPNRGLAIEEGVLRLVDPTSPRGHRLPIDSFFKSLAEDRHERAICIVLAGTGQDGTLGVRAVKAEGGMAMAQAPDGLQFDGMPRSAIATGMVDFVLPPEAMPAQLLAFAGRAFGEARGSPPGAPGTDDGPLAEIVAALRARTGHDFSGYKETTIRRRIERRLAVLQIEGLAAYARFLQGNGGEVEALFSDLLIGVTAFFRDPHAFAMLEEKCVRPLVAGQQGRVPIRVWVPACSTGEEAYSIAILLLEHLEAARRSARVQIFATDIDSRAIEQARSGTYPAGIAADVLPERLARFFEPGPDEGTYRVQRRVRDLLNFSVQDLLRDPPFSRLDLISCRNLLIYLEGSLQERLIPLFHYALNPGGGLFLGASESIGEAADLFATADRGARLYRRGEGGRPRTRLGAIPTFSEGTRPSHRPAPRAQPPSWRELTEQALLQHHGAVGALVDDAGEIVYLHGRTGLYLEPAPGEAGVNILRMAREGLRRDLGGALHRAKATGEPVRCPGLRVKTNGDHSTIDLTVLPVAAGAPPPALPRLLLVCFDEAGPAGCRGPATPPSAPAPAREPGSPGEVSVAALQEELRSKEAHLQTINQELELANAELTSGNEELQSLNEELQSTNEELETAKEELQSVNEELTTVNSELQQKVADLSRANGDLANLIAATNIATVFVDEQLRVQRFTQDATRVVNLIRTDVGRPLGHVVSNLVGYDRLTEDTQEVLRNLVPREIEVRTKAGTWHLLRIQPYRTTENVIAGAVITFVDITALKRMQAELQEAAASRHLAAVVRDSSDAIVVQEPDGRILAWNPAATRLYGWSEPEALAMDFRQRIPESHRRAELAMLQELGRAGTLERRRARRLAKDGRALEVWLTASVLVDPAGKTYAISTTERLPGDGDAT